jgi:putative hydrolase of the HAD superfamily
LKIMQRSKKKKLLIFDMDGTLYNFKEGSFRKSGLRKKVLKNAELFIAKKLSKSRAEAKIILNGIEKKYGEDISIAIEKEYGVNRYEYFDTVWDIPARKFIEKNTKLKSFLLDIAKAYDYVLVSDAPKVWIKNVLDELKISDLFEGKIYSGERKKRKGFGNIFEYLAKRLKYKPENCVVIGDQENTDIIPAKKCGMNAVLIGKQTRNTKADYTISNILGFKKIVDNLIKKEILNGKITILSTFAKDKLFFKKECLYKEQDGGPAFYISRVFEDEKIPFDLKSVPKIEVDILINKRGEFGKILSKPEAMKIDYSKIESPYLFISTILDEVDLSGINNFKGKVFIDIQGYVRNGNDFGRKKFWNPKGEIADSFFCVKGTKEEIEYIPIDFRNRQKKKMLVITDGSNGSVVYCKGIKYKIKPKEKIKVADTIGAGDTYLAYFICKFIVTESARVSIEYATKKVFNFLSDKRKEKKESDTLLVALTHGDELIGKKAIDEIKSYRNDFDWLIANPVAYKNNVRFVDIDLNRCAPGNLSSSKYEERRVVEVLKAANKYKFVIDLHGSTNDKCGIFVIITNPTRENLLFASLFKIKNIVIWPSRKNRKIGPWTKFLPRAIEIENCNQDRLGTKRNLINILTNFLNEQEKVNFQNLDMNKALNKKNVFLVYGVLKNNRTRQKFIDFKLCNYNKETFYPLLTNTYKKQGVLCYKMRKLNNLVGVFD